MGECRFGHAPEVCVCPGTAQGGLTRAPSWRKWGPGPGWEVVPAKEARRLVKAGLLLPGEALYRRKTATPSKEA